VRPARSPPAPGQPWFDNEGPADEARAVANGNHLCATEVTSGQVDGCDEGDPVVSGASPTARPRAREAT
jgi:hypothetical protein